MDNTSIAIKNLKDKNVLVPIEKISVKTIGSNDYVTGSVLYVYNGDRTVPAKVYGLKLASPVLLSSFTQSSIDGSGNFQKDSHYEERINFAGYDQFNNLRQAEYTNNVSKSYIYDYSSLYPVCEVINSDTTLIAYTSFEADRTGGWSSVNSSYISSINGGITGKKYYSESNFSLSKSALSSGTSYTVTYWTKNGGYSIGGTATGYPRTLTTSVVNGQTWTLYEHLVTGQTTITVAGSGAIDELRLYPSNAQMTTYTYEPLIGISSQCDMNNRIIYYEYDGFNRLKLIRDQDYNILKVFDYKYQATPQQ
jgi:hypothetical protein